MNRRTYVNFCRAFTCVVIVLTSLTPRLSFAQQSPPTTQEWAFGYEAFNLLLQESDIKICTASEWSSTPSDEKFVILINQNNTGWLSHRETPALVMCSNGKSLDARFRPALGLVDPNQTQDFYSSQSCPIVRPRSTQEVFFGVHEIVCNTPGYISPRSVRQQIDEQLYPPTSSQFRGDNAPMRHRFSVLSVAPERRIWVADPLLFTNQMLFKADNLRFADNTVRWLSDDFRRKKVLLLINGRPQSPVDPNDLDILTPIPTHGEVIQAIRQLITKEIIGNFANTALPASEDENIFNDLALNYADGLADGQINRLVLFAIFACCCTFALATYFWQRRVLRRTASVTASRRQRNFSKREKGSDASERQAAASMLLNSFCLDVANRRLADWPEFPTPIVSQHNAEPAVKATHEMADAFWRLRTKPKTYWTKEALAQLEESTYDWRELLSEDQIALETEASEELAS